MLPACRTCGLHSYIAYGSIDLYTKQDSSDMTVPGRIIRPIDQKTEYQWYIDQMNVNYNSVATLTEEERSSLTKHLPKIFGPFLSGESVDPETGRADLSCVVLVAVTANGELCGTITSILRETDSHPERRFIVRRSALWVPIPFRGRGIGTDLIGSSEARTGPNGETPHEAILDVNVSGADDALRLYKSLGYMEDEECGKGSSSLFHHTLETMRMRKVLGGADDTFGRV